MPNISSSLGNKDVLFLSMEMLYFCFQSVQLMLLPPFKILFVLLSVWYVLSNNKSLAIFSSLLFTTDLF
jgi:hypothetical protein